MKQLSNPKMWEGKRPGVKTTVGRLTNDHCNKIDIALSIWQPVQRYPFLCCCVEKWQPDGVYVYITMVRFLRHICEIHLPVLYQWDCPLTFDCRGETHARRNIHHLAWRIALKRFSVRKSKAQHWPMQNLMFHHTLCLNLSKSPKLAVGESLRRRKLINHRFMMRPRPPRMPGRKNL